MAVTKIVSTVNILTVINRVRTVQAFIFLKIILYAEQEESMSNKKKTSSYTSRNIWRRRQYHIAKQKGICVICHKPLDRDGAVCESCLQKNREEQRKRRQLLISVGICPVCGKNDIFKGEVSCPECKAKAYIFNRKNAEKNKQRMRDLTNERKAKGLCIRCGKNPSDENHVTCAECREKMRKANKKKRLASMKSGRNNVKAEWKSQQKCSQCGADELVPGKSVCPRCYAIRLKAIKDCNRTRRKDFNETWKQTNMKVRASSKKKRNDLY